MDARLTGEQGVFAVAGGICVLAAANAVFRRDPLAAAISLTVTLFSLAVLYLGLGAEFLAWVQIAVYAGAIMVLFVFVVMLLGAAKAGERLPGPRMAVVAPLVATLLFALLSWSIVRGTIPSPVRATPAAESIDAIADAVYVRYLLPFEIVSVLLLAALIAAVVLARKRSTEREWPRH